MDLEAVGLRSYISEPAPAIWKSTPIATLSIATVGAFGLSEAVERPFAHLYETGGCGASISEVTATSSSACCYMPAR